jgi:hypothetical protein
VASVCGRDPLRGHAHAIAGLSNAACEDVGHTEGLGDAAHLDVLPLERER